MPGSPRAWACRTMAAGTPASARRQVRQGVLPQQNVQQARTRALRRAVRTRVSDTGRPGLGHG
jgi:hypothetical protein